MNIERVKMGKILAQKVHLNKFLISLSSLKEFFMKSKLSSKIIAFILVLATLITTLPLTVLAEEVDKVETTETPEVYIKSIKLVSAKTEAEARHELETRGYVFLDQNLNAGTDENGIWMGYTETTNPTEAIYDLKVMNMKGGFTLTSVADALREQETAFTQMAVDLNYLVEEFVEAYNEKNVAAEKAYKALNFFRVVNDETALEEANGLGYQLVHGGISLSTLTEIIMLCDSDIVDSIVKILTMGIQTKNANWMEKLSEVGVYESDVDYGEDENEVKRRAEQILVVLQFYAEAYNAMDKSGLLPESFDDSGNPVYDDDKTGENLPAEKADVKKLDESRYKMYKVVFDELAKYKYGDEGDTLKDFFASLEKGGTAKKLYPLVSVLTDGEFAALSYGCFLELANGVTTTSSDFDNYDEYYAEITKEVQSLYLYQGVDKALLNNNAIIGFTDDASRHMAATGELEFYEKESYGENAWETGKNVAKGIGALGSAVIGLCKITYGATMLISGVSATVAASVKSGMLAGVMKFCTMVSGMYAVLIVAAAALITIVVSYLVLINSEDNDNDIDWKDNPIPHYIYDVKEISFNQTSTNDGIATETIKKPVFTFYEAATDFDNVAMDMNAFSDEASQWNALYFSYDKQGDDAKPIKSEDLLVKMGDGETPEGYVALTAFGRVVPYNLNQWDDKDKVNGIYFFYKQDNEVAVESGVTYYIYDVYLQVGESDAHCIDLLEAAGYTPLNVNLTPGMTNGSLLFDKDIYTYLGYKTTTNPSSAIRDLRFEYGPSCGEFKHGSSTYAECGSNGYVTLYATKYKSAGTPILAGGIVHHTNRRHAAAGFEPINLFAGGPAVNINAKEGIYYNTTESYLYFLPETTFVEGTEYLSGIGYASYNYKTMVQNLTHANRHVVAYLKENAGWEYTGKYQDEYNKFNQLYVPNADEAARVYAMYDFISLKAGYDHFIHLRCDVSEYGFYSEDDIWDSVMYSKTYNPYRAIYDIKGTEHADGSPNLTLESSGYSTWTTIDWFDHSFLGLNEGHVDNAYLSFNGSTGAVYPDIGGRIYVTGNTSADNVYNATVGAMSERQPIRISDFHCVISTSAAEFDKSIFLPVTEMFTDSKEAILFENPESDKNFSFYFIENIEDRPYVSAITAVDALTLYRSYNSKDFVIHIDDITDGMMLAQLANQGATNFCGIKPETGVYESYSVQFVNSVMFGYTRSSESSQALRDVFIYFNGFSTDKPPQDIYRGSIKYSLLCEVSFNETHYYNAPKIGMYLYGTTDSRAGNRIVDFAVTDSPFKDGYETVRTQNGGSFVTEVREYVAKYADEHPSDEARDLFLRLEDFLADDIMKQEFEPFYFHIQREGGPISEQEPYVEEIYIVTGSKREAQEKLLHMGAEEFVDINLNKGTLFGSNIYMGYKRTTDPKKAITRLMAYHKKNPPQILLDEGGFEYELVSDIDLNKGAGGDYIYLYASREDRIGYPITKIEGGTKVRSESGTIRWNDGTYVIQYVSGVLRWGTDSYSDFNRWAGGSYVYLMYTCVYNQWGDELPGLAKETNYGVKNYTRKAITGLSAKGKYIGALFVMDKNTLRQEKLASGVASEDCTCDKITDQEVFDRLYAMGATTIIETPINITGDLYEDNHNKVFIGYSRTNDSKKAIKNIAIKAEVFSLDEPEESIDIDKPYKLVAEAATNVAELPRAINLIGLEDCQDVALPRLYLYYSTSGTTDPIYDICIDADPIKNGWNTVRSANKIDAYRDISNQSSALLKDGAAIKTTDGISNIYNTPLSYWTYDIYHVFNPASEDVTPFYIHMKKFSTETLAEAKPYVGEVFVTYGLTKHEAIVNMLAYDVDEYINVDLNENAGGHHVYIGYKRVAKEKDALTDIVVYEGKNPAASNRVTIGEYTVKYSLVSDVDLNKSAGGKYLYLYASDSSRTGNPIRNLTVEKSVTSYLKCGVERVTVKRADGKTITDESININKSAGGEAIYLVMQRDTREGHNLSPDVEKLHADPTCGDVGHDTVISTCLDCGARLEDVTEIPATGDHFDAENDGNHKCDVCGKKSLTNHVRGEAKEESRKEATEEQDGSYKLVYYCTECNTKLSESKVVIPAGTPAKDSELGASVIGRGSIIAICYFVAIAVVAAAVVYFTKKKQGDDE